MKTKIYICLFSLFLLTSVGVTTSAQEGGDKNFRFGLKFAPSLNWYKPDDVKVIKNDGMKFGYSWGLITEFRLAGMAHLSTGLQLDNDGGRIAFTDTVRYFLTTKNEFVEANKSDTTNLHYIISSRTYSTKYVSLPFILKMKTKEIGYMTYFGQFGLLTSILTKAKSDDVVYQYGSPASSASTKNDMDISKGFVNFFRASLVVGGGVEYNLTGSTSLLFNLNYNYGFTNALKKKSDYMINSDGSQYIAKVVPGALALTVGILF
jgi:hypothetical protein